MPYIFGNLLILLSYPCYQGKAIRDRIQERLRSQARNYLLYEDEDDDKELYDDDDEYYSEDSEK